MSLIISDLFEELSPFCSDSGVCATSEAGKQRIIKEYNTSAAALIKRLDSSNMTPYWCFRISSKDFWLPEDCLQARQVWIDGQSMEQRDEWFRGKLAIGLERCPMWQRPWIYSCNYQQLVDLGDGFAIPQNWPNHKNLKAAFVAESNADAGQVIKIRLKNEYGDEVDEEVTLLNERQPAITLSHVTDIRAIRKPETDGGIQLHVYYDYKGLRTSFAYYPSWIKSASFRRKTIPGFCPSCEQPTILIKGKLRFRPVRKENDFVQIEDSQALGFAMLAMSAMRKREPTEYNNFMTLAVNELQKQLQNETSPAASGQIVFKSPFGRRQFQKAWGG
jgi:hypothetical protein